MFAPGNHPRKAEKVFGAGADAAILDLEDAVPLAEKPATRATVVEALKRPREGLGYVRVNAFDTEFCQGDLALVVGPWLDGIVLPKAESIPGIVTAGGDTLAVRCPAHPVMRAVLAKCGFPLAAPSANRSNRVSSTRAEHVVDQLGGHIPLVLDGGACDIGIESTVIDLTGDTPTLLRPGMISFGQLKAVIGSVATAKPPATAEPLKSPGQLQQHYSPRAKLILVEGDLGAAFGEADQTIHVIARTAASAAWPSERWHCLPDSAGDFARELYDTLHRCDRLGAGTILVQSLPGTDEWAALRDRLNRAAAGA